MNYIGLSKYDTANGDGIRASIFVSGCRLHCKGCFNQESWDFNAGKPLTEEVIDELLDAIDSPYMAGLSILGGDPFEPENREGVFVLCTRFRKRFGASKTLWIWSGRKYERLIENRECEAILSFCDVLVDGAFIEHLKVTGHHWYGSSNQRVLKIMPEGKKPIVMATGD